MVLNVKLLRLTDTENHTEFNIYEIEYTQYTRVS